MVNLCPKPIIINFHFSSSHDSTRTDENLRAKARNLRLLCGCLWHTFVSPSSSSIALQLLSLDLLMVSASKTISKVFARFRCPAAINWRSNFFFARAKALYNFLLSFPSFLIFVSFELAKKSQKCRVGEFSAHNWICHALNAFHGEVRTDRDRFDVTVLRLFRLIFLWSQSKIYESEEKISIRNCPPSAAASLFTFVKSRKSRETKKAWNLIISERTFLVNRRRCLRN